MGLSFHYNGTFNKNAHLSDLITEVKEVCETFKWKFEIYRKEFPMDAGKNSSYAGEIYGISFTPPECETVDISFLSNYKMSNFINLKFYGFSDNQQDKEYLYMLSAKTQYAGINVHKIIIELFRHLKKQNYFSDFNLTDEGEYWETGDEKLLEIKFKRLGSLIDSFSLALQSVPIEEKESLVDSIERISKKINDIHKQ